MKKTTLILIFTFIALVIGGLAGGFLFIKNSSFFGRISQKGEALASLEKSIGRPLEKPINDKDNNSNNKAIAAEGAAENTGIIKEDIIFKSKDIKRIIFITIDTMRGDHYGFMGYPRNTTPFLDSLAEGGIVFKNAFTVVSETNPSHISMFTSLYHFEHKVFGNQITEFNGGKILAEYLKEKNFITSAFVSAPYLKLLENRFDNFNGDADFNRARNSPIEVRSSDETINRAISWLDKNSSQKNLFLWAHLFDTHLPFSETVSYMSSKADKLTDAELADYWINSQGVNPDFFTGDQKESLKNVMDKYDGEAQFVDRQIERLFNYMDQNGYNKDALWVITSDHGEGLGSHSHYGHFERVYNEQLKAPIIFYNPEAKTGKVINSLVENIDIMPTLADLVGFKIDGHFSGRSLSSLISGAADNVRDYVFSSRGEVVKDNLGEFPTKYLPVKNIQDEDFLGQLYSLQDQNYKYIYSPDAAGRDKFFNLKNDPNELHNIISDQNLSAIKAEMKNKIIKILNGENIDLVNNANAAPSDAKLEELLRSLGY